MPGLFDALKEGVIGVFSGQATQGQDPNVGRREGLISAGLATLASDSQDPLQALAQGAMFGRQAAAATREQAKLLKDRAALSEFIGEAGFDRDGLTSIYMRTLATGDLETAKSISEILKSMPDAPKPVNRQNVSTTLSLAAGAPPAVVERLGEGTQVEVQRDPRTGQIFWESALPSQPPADPFPGGTIKTPDPTSPTGFSQFGVRADGSQVFMGHVAGPSGGTGGAQQAKMEGLSEAMIAAEGTLSTVDSELANPIVNILAGMIRGGGITGNLANMALGAISEDAQLAAASADQWLSAAVPLLSGAQMTENERKNYRAAYLPIGGGSPRVLKQKAAARAALAAMFGPEQLPTKEQLNEVLINAGLPPVEIEEPTIEGMTEGDAMEAARIRLRRRGGGR